MKIATLVYLIKNGQVLMIYGSEPHAPHYLRYNGPGGKKRGDETLEECARREVWEETNLEIGALDHVGAIRFFGFREPDNDWLVHLYRVYEYTGEPKANRREGHLRWFPIADVRAIPTCDADQTFLHWVFGGRHFDAEVEYMGERCVNIRRSFRN